MALLDSLQNLGTNIVGLFRPASKPGEAGVGIAQMSVPWEVTTPQYPITSVYSLAQQGYMRNEIVYACIQKRMQAVGSAPMRVWDGEIDADDSSVIDKSPVAELLRKPNDFMHGAMFWQATQLYMDVAGFSVWEKQYNRRGEVIALYPMRPDWCSFRRGTDRMLAIVRYQPAGWPFVDVPIERCVVFMEPSPIWMGIRSVSKSMVAMRIGATDNAATDFMTTFFQRGAMINGLISITQSLQNAEADRIRDRWQDVHGGANQGKIAVLGNGSTYQPIQMSFRDMDFTNIDGRDEARICAIFGVSPLLLGAKVGLSASTLSNFEQARKQLYEETIMPVWENYAGVIESQLVPDFAEVGQQYCGFDLRNVKALQEDRDLAWARAMNAAKSNIITRNEARAEMKLDPIDDANVFVGTNAQPVGEETVKAEAPAQLQGFAGKPAPPVEQPVDDTIKALTAWRKSAIVAVKHGVTASIPDSVDATTARLVEADLQSCKSASDVREVFERHWPRDTKTDGVSALLAEVREARIALEATR